MLLGFTLPLKRLLTQLEFSLPTFSLPTFPAKSLGHVHSSNACLILGSDPDAVGVHVALKETPLLFEFFPAHLLPKKETERGCTHFSSACFLHV